MLDPPNENYSAFGTSGRSWLPACDLGKAGGGGVEAEFASCSRILVAFCGGLRVGHPSSDPPCHRSIRRG